MLQNNIMQSNSQIQVLREQLKEYAPMALEELKKVIQSNKTPSKTKLDAITLILDRIGLPALRASINQTVVSQNQDLGSLIETKTKLMLENNKVDEELRTVEVMIGKDTKD